jgi:hypothetical protein
LLVARVEQWIRPAAFAGGILIVVVALGHLTIRSTGRTLGAELRIALVPSGETQVSRIGPFLVATDMRPHGRMERGAVSVANTAGKTLAFRVRAKPSAPDLDKLVRVDVSAGGGQVYRGTLGALRSWTRQGFMLQSGARTRLELRVWLPASVAGGYRGRIEDVDLELKAGDPAA